MSEKIKTEKCQEYLQYRFTPEELKEKGLAMAQSTIEADNLEGQKKSVMSDFKVKIEAAQLQVNINARHIRDGFWFRNIDCEKVHDYATGTVSTFRTDTGECVKSRQMRPDERQQTIFRLAGAPEAESAE